MITHVRVFVFVLKTCAFLFNSSRDEERERERERESVCVCKGWSHHFGMNEFQFSLFLQKIIKFIIFYTNFFNLVENETTFDMA